ncbi:Gut specific cysteine proteinase [Trichuris trichiura]|uniref:Gut specific cysteine proteinase n=1 Tax=Trichuris trichiura TaxID=36087 RepID=A0A077ZHU2_TRITR|nr:Gut specific cysteine proteinase [Trichuris trichiura]
MHYQLLFLFGLAACSFAAYYEEQYEKLKQKFQQRNNNVVPTWKAIQFGMNPYFKDASEAALKRLLGVKWRMLNISTPRVASAEVSNGTSELPAEFDARKQWSYCKNIRYIKDQSNCGSCWAVSAASVMSDRYCIASKGRFQPFLSEEELVSCCRTCGDGCGGGFPEMAFVYWATRGVPTGRPYGSNNSCKPYTIKPCPTCVNTAETPKCQHHCADGYKVPLSADRYFGKLYLRLLDRLLFFARTMPRNHPGEKGYSLRTEKEIMRDIYKHGPVVGAFIVYDDFFYYTDGIYQHHPGAQPVGAHAVRIIGWGKSSKPYWLIANSWSETFGEKGLFRILRGTNECEIEGGVVAARARLPK